MKRARAVSWALGTGIALAFLLPTALAQGRPAHEALRCLHRCPPGPPARGYSHLMYDWRTGQAYLMGGASELTLDFYDRFDVWRFNTVTRRWTRLFHSDTFFPALNADAMALDARSRKVVTCSFNGDWEPETWLYDLDTNTFENVTPDIQPAFRWGQSMVYDDESDRVILFGGSDNWTGETLNDTWAFDVETRTWTPMAPYDSPPPAHYAAMVYDPRADRVILFGGVYNDGNWNWPSQVNDTWAYDFNNDEWTNLGPTGSPPGRHYHSLTYDWRSDRIIMFGGAFDDSAWPYEPTIDETWSFSFRRNQWKKLTPRVIEKASVKR